MKRIFPAFVLLALLTSCDPEKDPNPPPTNSSAKLKSVVESYGGKRAMVITVEYDASGRVTKINEMTQDSNYVPLRISYANYHNFTYNGNGTVPVKNIITHEASRTPDTAFYYYDGSNRIIKQELFDNGISWRNLYTYPSTGLVVTETFYRNGSNVMVAGERDSVLYDGNKAVMAFHKAGGLTHRTVYNYDTKLSPFAQLNVFQALYSFYGEDRHYQHRAPVNETMYQYISTNDTISIASTYSYGSNNYPVSGNVVGKQTGQPTEYATLKFEYY
jgi:hypothetical protein